MSLPLERIDQQYEIVAKIKEGGMGEIYKVRHRLLDELRVVKVLHSDHVGDTELTERFAREARAAIQLRHPNIIQIFDFTVDESGTGLIVMEYIRGTDLRQLLRAPRLPSVALTIEIARQGLRALGYLHRNGFVHRDVSPDNLMLSCDVEGRPLVKVIDLGIAKRRGADSQLTASGIFLGKFRYASPEHFGAQGSGGIEARSDLYTFGLVLYELLTGRYPIQGESMSQLIAGHLFQPPHDFADTDPGQRVPPALRQAVLKTLAKDPCDRFASADELIACLDALQAGYPVDDAVLEESRGFVDRTPRRETPPDRVATDRVAPDRVATDRVAPDRVAPEMAEPAVAEPENEPVSESSAHLDALIQEVDELLQSGQLTAADRLLSEARESHGPAPELTPVAERLDQRQARAIADLEQRLLAMIQRRDFQEAREALIAARPELGAHPAFEPLRRLMARTVSERIEELVQKAGLDLEDERFEAAAERLDKALRLDPDNTWIQDHLEQVRRARRRREADRSRLTTTPLSPGLMQALTDIEARRAQGDPLAAWRLLREATETHGENDAFVSLRRAIAEEILNEDDEPEP